MSCLDLHGSRSGRDADGGTLLLSFSASPSMGLFEAVVLTQAAFVYPKRSAYPSRLRSRAVLPACYTL